MAYSTRYRELRARLRLLRAHMLPASFSPTGDYSYRQLDRARGYRLLAHAEIEAFLEDISLRCAKTAFLDWRRNQQPSPVIVCLIAHYHHGFDVDQEDLQPAFGQASRPKTKDAVEEIVDVALRQYVAIHDQNHGVREKNLKRLCLPIGVRKDQLDPTWLTNLDEFGKKRGDVAHNTAKAQQLLDPQSELQDVENLMEGLLHLDQLVIELTEKSRASGKDADS